ncbi:MAG: sigma-70 family RNA polymerase sigma factor [Planctomycetes bacterium]|nr:sigma-70 family RNA polymerase sigma factor [Planctomycetota bacterium]
MTNEMDRGAQFMRLYLEHQRRIYGLILALVPAGPDADDVLQEACAVLWQKFDEFTPGTNFGAWALRIARYQVMAFYTTRRRQKARLSDETLEAVVERMSARTDREDARSAALDGCLEGMPAPDRELIELRYRAGASVEDVARRSGKTVEAAYKALHRAHERLLQCMRGKLATENAL